MRSDGPTSIQELRGVTDCCSFPFSFCNPVKKANFPNPSSRIARASHGGWVWNGAIPLQPQHCREEGKDFITATEPALRGLLSCMAETLPPKPPQCWEEPEMMMQRHQWKNQMVRLGDYCFRTLLLNWITRCPCFILDLLLLGNSALTHCLFKPNTNFPCQRHLIKLSENPKAMDHITL